MDLHKSDLRFRNHVQSVMAFANWELKTDGAPQALLFGDQQNTQKQPSPLLMATPEDQIKVRRWLDSLIKLKKCSRTVANEISEALGSVRMAGNAKFNKAQQRLNMAFAPRFENAAQWMAFGIATLVEDGFASRVGQCGLNDCQNYFIDWSGRHQMYCCESHASKARVRRKRKLDRERQML